MKQRDHCISPLSNKQFHVCIGEIQVLLDDPTGNPKKVSKCALVTESNDLNQESLGKSNTANYRFMIWNALSYNQMQRL